MQRISCLTRRLLLRNFYEGTKFSWCRRFGYWNGGGKFAIQLLPEVSKEAVNLSRLDHPNIVRVTDSFKENGTYYYVMEYIEGQNLNEYVENHHINEREAVEIIKSIADALIYMHEKHHMLHLDLKPGNVMRRISDGQVFLIDLD